MCEQFAHRKIGFIGQGWIGKNLADHFEERDFEVVRYSLDEPYCHNKDAISSCDVVFIAVPTPTTQEGFSATIIEDALSLVGVEKVAVIKSTLLPGVTDALSSLFPDRYVFHSPEFLREASVRGDIDHPDRNIIGIPSEWRAHRKWQDKAQEVLDILPRSQLRVTHNILCTAVEAEVVKHGGNEFLCLKTVFMNMLYDLLAQSGGSWDAVAQGMMADSRIGASHMYPVHQYRHMSSALGRGAGGHCFPKDLAALRQHYERVCSSDHEGIMLIRMIEVKNNRLLADSGKDLHILRGIYGSKPYCICDATGNSQCTCGMPLID